ncbi:hypothetical protein VP01_3541g1 [Puccinia sorghi]|uniref:Damage-control phosphatase ARMT1-like metal-binding domain-containing protein n=1 Tax=Puccinia sorghi TaxID=27349 RepID=A0A0L6UXE4_9BASI|nr:hypothetical protein VP01_3541g1 [Puccinia sorghi]
MGFHMNWRPAMVRPVNIPGCFRFVFRPILPRLIMPSTIFPNSNHQPRVYPYSPSNVDSFAFQSVTKRWPKILTQVIDHLVFQNNQLLDQLSSTSEPQALKAKISQGKAIISLISELKYEAARDKELSLLKSHPDYTEQENLIINLYNQELSKTKAAEKSTWFSASWLVKSLLSSANLRSHRTNSAISVMCLFLLLERDINLIHLNSNMTYIYILRYQRLHGFFNQHEHWRTFDPFEHQKLSSFRSSWNAVSSLCLILDRLTKQQQSSSTDHDTRALQAQFNELLSACLWGNATPKKHLNPPLFLSGMSIQDLSLLPNMSHEEIQHLQTSSSRKPEYVLRDDSAHVWQACFDLKAEQLANQSRRIDFVLDNAGFELFTDLVLADCSDGFKLSSYSSSLSSQANPLVSLLISQPDGATMVSLTGVKWKSPLSRFLDHSLVDLYQLLASMVDPTIFFALTGIDSSKSTDPDSSAPFSDHTLESHVLIVQEIGKRWKSYFQSELHPFLFPFSIYLVAPLCFVWTNPLPFWDIPSRDQKLLEELKAAELVIFKVNFSRYLNYRKLTGDAMWEAKTTVEEAIGPLNGLFNLLSLRLASFFCPSHSSPALCLLIYIHPFSLLISFDLFRTCKADVCVGLSTEKEAWVSNIDPDWRVNGKYVNNVFFCTSLPIWLD